MIDVNTKTFDYTLYGDNCYLALKETSDPIDTDFIYAGYYNGVTPYNIPVSEWEALQGYSTGLQYSRIAGDIYGFTDSETWHTPLHIFGGDGTTYAMGTAVHRHKSGTNDLYYLSVYYYTDTWDEWRAGTYISFTKTLTQSVAEVYITQPEFIYLDMYYTSQPDVSGGIYYYDTDGVFHHTVDNRLGDLIGTTNTSEDGVFTPVSSAPTPQPDPYNPLPQDEDPYKQGGSTTIGGGGGTFSITGDNVDFPSLPALTATDTGFITLFNPTTTQLNALSNYMWSGAFDLATYKKIFADPMDCILGLSIVPVAVPNGGTGVVTVGNISTGVSMTKAGQQYVEVDCGSITINEFWGAYLDYAPYTKIELYLPYCGTHPLDTDDVMKKTIHVKYHVDILSGACCAYVKCGNAVLYSFVGQCSSSIPVTGNDWTNVINGTLSIAASVGTLVATGGMSAPVTGAAAMSAGASAATNVMNMKPHVEKSGAMGGTGGMMGLQQPYLILTLPKQARPQNQNLYTGYPSYITASLSTLSGYTEVYSIRLVGITATQQEKDEIVSLLKGGVII